MGGGLGNGPTNPFNQPPPSMNSALNSAKQLGHINEQQLLQSALSGVVESMEKSHLRPLQRASFVCSTECCDDTNSTQQNLQRCLQKCSVNVQRANQAFNNELQRFQQRIQRQAQECQESARDMQMGGTSENDTQLKYKACTDRVFANNRVSIPDLEKRLSTMLTPQ